MTKCKNIIKNNGLKQIVTDYTRVTNRSKTLIDYIVTNNTSNIECLVLQTPKISDHSIVEIQLLSHEIINNYKIVKYKDYKNFNLLNFQLNLINSKWCNNSTDVNFLSDILVNQIKETLNKMLATKELKVYCKYENNKWINSEILAKIKDKDLKYKRAVIANCDNLWNEYKSSRNELSSMIRISKENYYRNILDENKTDSKTLWKNLKPLIQNKNKPQISKILKINNNNINITAELPNVFTNIL